MIAPALAAHVPSFAARLGVERRVDRNVVALTFDDGPDPRGTPAVIEALAKDNARATFFLVGEQVDRHPAVAREIVDAGHEVALHCYRHTLLLRRRTATVAADLDRALDSIGRATGQAPALYRPPYGVLSAGALKLVRRRGYRTMLWSTWGRDWERRATPESIARRATNGLRPGDVVLLHDSDAYSSGESWCRTVAAVPSVLEAIAALGVSADSVTQST
ncbi:MAG TPA: polysaccharide deacetylase family protein [Gaiellaceae bacterium]|nr:polysaccharide deacetylase family protein [Gaiellaceae bacterium]